MRAHVKGYQYEAVLRFPLMPGSHETAWRYVFDWAVAGEALNCAPGDRILEFGSGTSYGSEWLNRLGYQTVAADLNLEILTFARDRMGLDRRVSPGRATFACADGQKLPFGPGTFDGVICLNALHHMSNYGAALTEIRRVLKAGGRAAFSEPGSLHADAPESKLAVEEYGAVERSVVLDDIHRIALDVGFERMIVKPIVYPQLVELDYRDLESYRMNSLAGSYLKAEQIARFLQETHSIFVLVVGGDKAVTSARPRLLQARIAVSPLPGRVRCGEELHVSAVVQNTGDTAWLSKPREFGGHVTFGIKLFEAGGPMISDTLGRTLLDHDVLPGQEIEVRPSFRLPESLEPGEYSLRFDMVDEQVAWFVQHNSPVVVHQIALEE